LVVEISELCDGEKEGRQTYQTPKGCGDIPFGNCSVSSDGKRIQYTPPTNLEYVGLLEKCSYRACDSNSINGCLLAEPAIVVIRVGEPTKSLKSAKSSRRSSSDGMSISMMSMSYDFDYDF